MEVLVVAFLAPVFGPGAGIPDGEVTITEAILNLLTIDGGFGVNDPGLAVGACGG